MVQSERRGLTRRQGACVCRSRGSAKRSGSWAVAVVALLAIAVVIATAGCGSGTQASATTTPGVTTAAQTGTGQSLPSGAPTGTAPSGAQGGPTSSTDSAGTTTTTAAVAGSTTSGEAATTTTAQAATTTTSLASGQHGDGIYEAGVDISTGLYRGSVAGAKAHWEVSNDANGDKYVAGADPTGQFYVNVTWGQYLRLNGVIVQKASYTPADPLATSKLTNGTYRAGYDIEVGWYNGTITAGEGTMGYWQISSDANGQTLVANDYPLGPFTLKVKWGQYLTLRGVTVSQQ